MKANVKLLKTIALALTTGSGLAVWTNPSSAGPDVFVTANMTRKDGQTSTATLQLASTDFFPTIKFF
jgi:hypothetical protein